MDDYKIVKDSRIWEDMAGDTELEKRLNSFLTSQFILTFEVPNEECLSEAKIIIAMIKTYT